MVVVAVTLTIPDRKNSEDALRQMKVHIESTVLEYTADSSKVLKTNIERQ